MNVIPGVSLNGRPLARYAIVRASTFEHDRKRERREAARRRKLLLEIERQAQEGVGPVSARERIEAIGRLAESRGFACPSEPAEFQAWFRRAIEV